MSKNIRVVIYGETNKIIEFSPRSPLFFHLTIEELSRRLSADTLYMFANIKDKNGNIMADVADIDDIPAYANIVSRFVFFVECSVVYLFRLLRNLW